MDPNWQTKLSSVRERNEYAFHNSLFCDVKLSVKDSNGVRALLPANKYVLAISSPVFQAMFYGELAESKPTIELPDCTKEGLHELLRYVNTDQVNLSGSTCMEVLYLAEKYMMPFLVEKCKDYLHDGVGPDDVLSVLPQVQKIGREDLLEHLWTIVDDQTFETMSSETFLNAPQEILRQIVERETLQIKELDLFCAVDRWAEERIKERRLDSNGKTKRAILGDKIIRLIRFPVMTHKEFAEVVLPCKILKEDEIIELFQRFCDSKPLTSMFIEKERFKKSRILIPEIRFRNVFQGGFYKDDYYGSIVSIRFTTNKPVDLVGVRMFGSKDSTHKVNLKILKEDKIISQLHSSFHTESEMIDGLYYGYTVNLDRPVRLQPSVLYTVDAEIDGPRPTAFGKGVKSTVTVEDITITYKDIKVGQFPTLVLQKGLKANYGKSGGI